MDEKIDMSADAIQQMLHRMSASAVFGEPIREGGATVIPVASVMYGFGLGSGSGPMPSQAGVKGMTGEGESASPMMGTGGGGGGGGGARPLGFIRIDGEGVGFEPIMNQNIVPVAGIAMVAWNVFWIAATVRAFIKRK
jgi:uncharacterized spore protein YtfJ